MRVTNKMLSDNFLRNMNVNTKNLKILQQQMSSGKEVNKPSDDPLKAARVMQLNTEINSNSQYNDNIKDTINWLDVTDTALGQAGDVLTRVRELLTSAGNAPYGTDERNAIKDEIEQKIGEFAQILNTNFDGKYIFGGTHGTTKPVDVDTDNKLTCGLSNDGNNKLRTEISQGVVMDYNVTATQVLESGAKINLETIFSNILQHLDNEDEVNNLSNSDLHNVIDAANNILNLRSEVGAKQNRMDSAKTKNEDQNLSLTEILSKTEDIDVTEKTMEYATAMNVYLASLRVSAKVLQPTLVDYIS